MKAGVAIVAYNSKQYWPRLRAALDAQIERDSRIIVVDNCSQADQRLTATDMPPNGELIQLEDNIGFAAANNLAAKKFDADYFVCLNPDAFPEPNWLTNLVAAAERRPDAGAVGSLQISADNPDLLDGAGDVYWAGGQPYRSLHLKPRPDKPFHGEETFSACAAAALYRKAAFDEAGGFDEHFFCFCEDVDLGFRMRLLGWRTIQADDAVVHHVGGGSASRRSDFAAFHGARNRMWTFVKNMPLPLLVLLLPVHIALTIALLSASLFRGNAAGTWRGVFAGLAGLPAIMNVRADVQASRRISSLAIVRAMAWSPFTALAREAVRRGSPGLVHRKSSGHASDI